MIYADTSCLFKVLRPEPLSDAVLDAMNKEERVIVSALTELEILVQLQAGWLGGDYSRPQLRRLETQLSILRNRPPYEFRALPSGDLSNGLAPAPQ